MSANVAPRRTLTTAVIPRPTWLIEAFLLGGGALFVALSAQVSFHIPGTPVPISGQTFSVLLVGSAYGATRGFSTIALYLALGIVGLPVYASGTSGWSVLSGATGGYLVGHAGGGRSRRRARRAPLGPHALLRGGVDAHGQRRDLRVRARVAVPRAAERDVLVDARGRPLPVHRRAIRSSCIWQARP